MTKFSDGPAAGVKLLLGRAPAYLRVTRDSAGKWDALDQIDDAPEPGETVIVYRKVSDDGTVHVDSQDERGRRRGAWYSMATYAVALVQPGDDITRDTTRWRAWCSTPAAPPTQPSEVMMNATEPEPLPDGRRDPEQIAALLAAPFDPAEIKFKPQSVSGNRALAIPYVDARVVMDRLDDVLGIANWADQYEPLAGGNMKCTLSLRLEGEWISREDVGSESEQPDEGDRCKAAVSDALKRTAVKFGVARYLYRQKPQWVDYDPQKRQFVRPPSLPIVQAPATHRPPAPTPRPPEKPARSPEHALQEYDADLASLGLFHRGDLVRHVSGALKPGHGADMSAWLSADWDAAREVTKTFVVARRQELNERIGQLLEAKGETAVRLAAKVGAGRGTTPEQLTHEQAARGVTLLSALPDATPARR